MKAGSRARLDPTLAQKTRKDGAPSFVLGLLAMALCALLPAGAAQEPGPGPAQLVETGKIAVDNRATPYVIRHLPVSSFPTLPAAVADQLTRHGCLIPQTYEARRPENVIHASLERAGSSDWAALCSVRGKVSLLVFFASTPDQPTTVATAPETSRLQAHDPSGVLGFNWGIDPASPEQVREAQASMKPRPARIDHDAVADSVVEHKTIYRMYAGGAWRVLDTPE